MKLEVEVREALFHFISELDWIQNSQLRFRNHGHTAQSVICVDMAGLICTRGLMFRQAKYPVRVYAIDDPPYNPSDMAGERKPVTPEAA